MRFIRKRAPLKSILSKDEWAEFQKRVSKTKVVLPPPEPPTAINEREWQKTWDLFNEAGYKAIEERRKKFERQRRKIRNAILGQ